MKVLYLLMALFTVYNNAFSKEHPRLKNKTYRYTVTFDNDSLRLHTSELVTMTITGKPWQYDSSQKELVIRYHYTQKDSIDCSSVPSTGWGHTCVTGMKDEPDIIWMHPLRSNQYMILESAPFPEVKFPLTAQTHYVDTFDIRGGWDYLSNNDMIFDYRVAGKETINGLSYWRIKATAIFQYTVPWAKKGCVNTADFLFNENEGFYSFEYHLFDKTHILIREK